ncbi:MAG: GPW/gp25 family protein [Pseudomonadota bacterium]
MSAPGRPGLPGLPIGFPLLPVPDEMGRLRWPTLDQSVRDTIRALLLTEPGELLLARSTGVGLARYLHRPNTLAERRELRDAIVAEITEHEPRVTLDAVELSPGGERGETLLIDIRYRILRTGTPGQLALTLKLAG